MKINELWLQKTENMNENASVTVLEFQMDMSQPLNTNRIINDSVNKLWWPVDW